MSEPIKVWRFHEAPPELQALSTNGGDEDWLAVIPPEIDGNARWYLPAWLECPAFGCCDVDEFPHPTLPGARVRIGCHA